MLRKILITMSAAAAIVASFTYYQFKESEYGSNFKDGSSLIQQQIVSVGKLIVTEGHFSEIITYKDRQKYLMDMVSFEKKALIVINADVKVSYDLRKVTYDIDKKNKKITILNIPKEEIEINPDIQFYDVKQSRMNPFTGEDYNKISQSVKVELAKKIEKSSLRSNAQNRLISELSKLLILTSNMGWKLEYNGQVIENEKDLDQGLKL